MKINISKTDRVFILVVAILAIVFLFIKFSFNKADISSEIKGFVQTLSSDAFTPPPLRGVFGEAREPLTDAGVLHWTNINRENVNAKDLTENPKLSKMAEQKLKDLFDKQYFEHKSPTGIGPGDLAKVADYDYIVIGENLALGNFNGDKALVDAWMASPGHRANILNVRYKEIGIAVGQGVFEGKKMWIAVQEFGLAVNACPQPSKKDKAVVDKTKKEVSDLETSLSDQKKVIDNLSPKYGEDYDAKIDEYNASVKRFNLLVPALQDEISAYNKQVSTFNTCADVTRSVPESEI